MQNYWEKYLWLYSEGVRHVKFKFTWTSYLLRFILWSVAQRNRIPHQARQLQQTLHEEGFDDFCESVPEMKDVYPTFQNLLQKLATFDCTCRTGKGGPPDCRIRNCARQRNITVCPQCEKYPCQHIQALAEHYSTLIPDGKRLQKIGLVAWLTEQKQRAKRGFAYADLRYPW